MSNTNATCALLASESVRIAITNAAYAAFFYVRPICVLLDFCGHFLSFSAFYKQSRRSKIYAFQFYAAVAKATDTASSTLKILTHNLLAGVSYNLGAAWYQKTYALMWFSAHIPLALNDMTTTICLGMTLATSIDRAYALGQPMKYKQLNRKKWETIAAVSAILVSVAISFFIGWQYMVDKDPNNGDMYKVVGDAQFQASATATVLVYVRSAVWILGVVAVIVSSVIMIFLYGNRHKKVATMTGGTNGENSKEKERRSAEKILSILTVYVVLQSINQISIMIVQTILAFKSSYVSCEGPLVSAVRNIETGIVNASDFYVMLLVSKQFRKMIRQALPGKKINVTVVSSQVAR